MFVLDGRSSQSLWSQTTAELDRWSKANLKAKKLLVLAVNIEPLLRIEGCEMAHEIWDKLNLIYDVQSAENIDLLRHKFHEIRWQTTSTIVTSQGI